MTRPPNRQSTHTQSRPAKKLGNSIGEPPPRDSRTEFPLSDLLRADFADQIFRSALMIVNATEDRGNFFYVLAAVALGFRESIEQQYRFFFRAVGVIACGCAPGAGFVVVVGNGKLGRANDATPMRREARGIVKPDGAQCAGSRYCQPPPKARYKFTIALNSSRRKRARSSWPVNKLRSASRTCR